MENDNIITTRNKQMCRDGEGERMGNNSNIGTRNKLKKILVKRKLDR